MLSSQANVPQHVNKLSSDIIVKNIMNYSKQNGDLLKKYDEHFYLNYFDKAMIQQALKKVGDNRKELELAQFAKLFINIIRHRDHQTLFLAMSLRCLFLKIKEETTNQAGIKFSDFTNYLCQRIALNNNDLIAPLLQIAPEKNVPDTNRIRYIDINPTIIYKQTEIQMPQVSKQKKIDKKLKQKKAIAKFIINQTTKQIIAMGRLSSCIYLYNQELQKTLTIIPKTYKDMSRQIAILSIAFSQCCQRLGAIINGIGIAFWQASDNYETQKTISRYYGDKIFYLALFREWITTDRNTIYYWNLKDQCVSNKIIYDQAAMINDVCEVNHLRCLCVSYTTKDQKKIFIVYKDMKPIVKYDLGSAGCHTLHYNIASQMLVIAGYHNQLQVFEIQSQSYSINLKKQLKGHSSIVTSLCQIKNSNYILSGDDVGEVRIWELNYMKCIQVVKVSKSLCQLYCSNQKLIFADSRLNVMCMDKFSVVSSQDNEIISSFFNQQSQQIMIITRKSIRHLNFHSGRIQKVFIICSDQQDASSALKISTGILVGTSKGKLKLFTIQGSKKWEVQAHQGQIKRMRYDRKARFLFTLGDDGKAMIWPEKTILQQGVKKTISFKNTSFNHIALFLQVRVVILASSEQSEIVIWDYQHLKLLTVIKMNAPVAFLQFNQMYRLLMISTTNDQVYFMKLNWNNASLSFKIIYHGNSTFSQVLKNKRQNNNEKIDFVLSNVLEQTIQKRNHQVQINESGNFVFNESSKKKINSKKIISKGSNQLKSKKNTLEQKNSLNYLIENKQLEESLKVVNSIKPSKTQNMAIFQCPSIHIIQGACQSSSQLLSLQSPVQQMQIKDTQRGTYLITSTSNGRVMCFNIDLLVKQCCQYQPIQKKESPHMYRPAKEDLQTQIHKDKHLTIHIAAITRVTKIKASYFNHLWTQNYVTKDIITAFGFIEMQNVYLSLGISNGTWKAVDIRNGTIYAHIKISQPLPMLWNISVQKQLYIRTHVYETLLILDDILTNHGFSMISKEYKAMNISDFLQMIKTKKQGQQVQQVKNKVCLLNQEFSLQDIKGIQQKQCTLKALEAYKRVKYIKDQTDYIKDKKVGDSNKTYNQDKNQKKVSAQFLRQKEDVEKLLSPSYFPMIAQKGYPTTKNKSQILANLEERSSMLLEKIKKHKKMHSLIDGQMIISKSPILRQQSQARQTHQPKRQLPLIKSQAQSLVISIHLKKGDKQNIAPALNSSLLSCRLEKLALSTSQSMIQLKVVQKSQRVNLLRSSKLSSQQKPVKQILNDINQKLQQYKKASYGKRHIL